MQISVLSLLISTSPNCYQRILMITFGDTSHRGDNMQSDKTCPILEQYMAYLITIKGRSQNTILE